MNKKEDLYLDLEENAEVQVDSIIKENNGEKVDSKIKENKLDISKGAPTFFEKHRNIKLVGSLALLTAAAMYFFSQVTAETPKTEPAVEPVGTETEHEAEIEVPQSLLNADNIDELTQQIKSEYEEIDLYLSEEAIADTLIYMNLKDMAPEEVANTMAARGETYSREELQELQSNAIIIAADVMTHNSFDREYASMNSFLLNEEDMQINNTIENMIQELKSNTTTQERKQQLVDIMKEFLVATKNPESVNGGYIDVGNNKVSKNDLDYAMEFNVQNIHWDVLHNYVLKSENETGIVYMSEIERTTIDDVLRDSGQLTKFNAIVDNCLDEYKPSIR